MDITMDNLEQIIQRYVLGQLDEPEAEAFEEYFLSRPDVAEQIDAAQQLHAGLSHLNSESALGNPQASTRFMPPAERSTAGLSMSQVLSRYLVGPAQTMIMAGLLIVLAPIALTSMQGSNHGVTAQLVRLDSATVRSTDASPKITLPANGDFAAVMVRVRDVEFPSYRLQVQGASTWLSEPFEFSSGARDHLVLIPPSTSEQRVEISLLGIAPDGEKHAVDFCNYTEACL